MISPLSLTSVVQRMMRHFPILVLGGVLFLSATPGAVAPAIEVASVVDPAPATPEPTLISNVWADSDIRQALRDVAEQARVTIVPDNTVQGLVSVELQNQPLEKALEIICRSGGFAYRKVDNLYYIVGLPEPSNPNYAALVDVTRIMPRYMKAGEIAAQLPPSFTRFLTVDAPNNVLVITAPSMLMRQIQSLVELLDRPTTQVVIECLVAEVSRSTARTLESQWRFNNIGFSLPVTSRGFPVESGGTSMNGPQFSWTQLAQPDIVNLRLLASEGRARVRAMPRLNTLSGRSAEIFVGNERYFSVLTGNINFPTSQLQLVSAGIRLKILPVVGTDGQILCELEPEVSDVIGVGANGAPEVATRKVRTQVQLRDGGTIALGGLLQTSRRRQKSKIPLLGDLPIIGAAFRSENNADIETEALIFIRPHILQPGESDWRGPAIWQDVPATLQGEAAVQGDISFLAWDPRNGGFSLGMQPVVSSGWYDLPTPAGAQVYLDISGDKRRVTCRVAQYDPTGGEHADAVPVAGENRLIINWESVSKTRLRVTQTSVIDGRTTVAVFDESRGATRIGGVWRKGNLLIRHQVEQGRVTGLQEYVIAPAPTTRK